MATVKRRKLPRTWSGKVVTDEAADRLADEIESTDGIKWERRRPVGPPRGADLIIPRVGLRIPSDLRAAIQDRANRERRTVSDLTREALEKLLREP